MRRVLRPTIVLLLSTVFLPGCIVVAISRFYDERSLTSDERLVGTWTDSEDNVEVTIEPSEWRSYRLSYSHPIRKGVLTGYLFTVGDTRYLDLTVARGEDPGPFVVAAHTVVRVEVDGKELKVAPLAHTWFLDAQRSGQVPALVPELSDRDQVVLAAPTTALETWLAGRGPNAPEFGAVVTFRKP